MRPSPNRGPLPWKGAPPFVHCRGGSETPGLLHVQRHPMVDTPALVVVFEKPPKSAALSAQVDQSTESRSEPLGRIMEAVAEGKMPPSASTPSSANCIGGSSNCKSRSRGS